MYEEMRETHTCWAFWAVGAFWIFVAYQMAEAPLLNWGTLGSVLYFLFTRTAFMFCLFFYGGLIIFSMPAFLWSIQTARRFIFMTSAFIAVLGFITPDAPIYARCFIWGLALMFSLYAAFAEGPL